MKVEKHEERKRLAVLAVQLLEGFRVKRNGQLGRVSSVIRVSAVGWRDAACHPCCPTAEGVGV